MKSYFLALGIGDSHCEQIAEALRNTDGVVVAQPLEGSSDLLIVVEAAEQNQVLELTNRAWASLRSVVDMVRFLPVQADQ